MKGDTGTLYKSSSDFFNLEGNHIMRLTATAAIDVCNQAAQRGLVLTSIDGGIWRDRFFEARMNCMWVCCFGDLHIDDISEVYELNLGAIKFIESEMSEHNAFILSTGLISKYLPGK